MLSVTTISKSFGGVQALRGASMDCAAAEIVGLIGPNGAGKSTLVNVISGILAPDRGRVEIGGQAVSGKGHQFSARCGIARTFQNIRLFRDLSVRQNIEVAQKRCQQMRPELAALVDVEGLLHTYGLSAAASDLAGTLPYGHQRRLEIARALATRPSILLLDEPAAGMNDEESAELAEIITGIREAGGCGVVVIDHDLKFINSICQRIFVMDQGAMIATGTPAEVWADPRVIEVYVGPRSPV